MRTKLTINNILFSILLYPIVLSIYPFIGENLFSITAPYFFGLLLFLVLVISIKNKVTLFRLLPIVSLLIIISLYNFSSFRYSLPLFFVFYIFILLSFTRDSKLGQINMGMVFSFLYTYIFLSIPFIFLESAWDDTQRFKGFVGSPTVYAGILTTVYVVSSINLRIKSYSFLLLTTVVFFLIYLSKTRLILVFIILYPFLLYAVREKSWISLKKMFFIFFVTSLSIYPLYEQAVKTFPSLVSLRYDDNRDASYGLRYFLYSKMKEVYFSGDLKEKLIGRGNEFSRAYVKSLLGRDLMPHNDFLRILVDWGAIGLLLFMLLFYKLSTKDTTTLFISLVYLLLFYSNMVFNLFLISLLIIFYSKSEDLNVNIGAYDE